MRKLCCSCLLHSWWSMLTLHKNSQKPLVLFLALQEEFWKQWEANLRMLAYNPMSTIKTTNEIKMGTFWKSKCEGYSMTPAFILLTVRKRCRRQSISTQRKLKCRSIWHCEENTTFCFQFSNPKSTLVGASQCLRGKQSLDSWKVTWNEVPKNSNLRCGEIWRVGR